MTPLQVHAHHLNREMLIIEAIDARPPPSTLQERFVWFVMCDFTPRSPSELPTSRWTSLMRLFHLFKPHAPMDVWIYGHGNLKQLITEWFKDHPAFVDLEPSAWCKRLKSNDPLDGGKCVFKFSFEYTPGVVAPNGGNLC